MLNCAILKIFGQFWGNSKKSIPIIDKQSFHTKSVVYYITIP